MKIYYDYQILLAQRYGGISRYFFELTSRLRAMGHDVAANCLYSNNYYFRGRTEGDAASGAGRLWQRLRHRAAGPLNRRRALRELREGYDIIHPTYYDPYLLGRYSGKLVVTVHDMIHEKYVRQYPVLGDATIAQKRKMLFAADRLIAISENTKRDILHFYPALGEDKISVVYHGASMSSGRRAGPGPLPGRPYILFTGNRGLYKNFERFFRAITPLLDGQKALHLFCAGGGAFSPAQRAMIGERYQDRIHQANLDDDRLADAYANAACFVFPSEYEGFGLPILEAFANHCPVVLSRSSSLPEVAGNAAEYFDPLDVEEMSEKIALVLEDGDLRTKLRERGRERLKAFSWDRTAQETLECYRKAVG